MLTALISSFLLLLIGIGIEYRRQYDLDRVYAQAYTVRGYRADIWAILWQRAGHRARRIWRYLRRKYGITRRILLD